MDPAHQAELDNRANQLNPNHREYRGGTTKYTGDRSQAALDNHANQLNPNNPRYRGPRVDDRTPPSLQGHPSPPTYRFAAMAFGLLVVILLLLLYIGWVSIFD
eukprot:EG_transcript_40099